MHSTLADPPRSVREVTLHRAAYTGLDAEVASA